MFHFLAQWLYWHLGVKGSGPWYGFWSGAGSDIGEYTVVTAIALGVLHSIRVHNCEVHQCWRVGRHQTLAGHKVCRKHHPEGAPTAEDVQEAHERASGSTP